MVALKDIMFKKIILLTLIIFLPFIAFASEKEIKKVIEATKNNEAVEVVEAKKTKENDFNVKIAVVDVESIFEHSIAIKDVRKKINIISDDIQAEMSRRELELKKAEELLIKERGVIAKNQFEEKIAEFNKKISKIQQLLQIKKTALEQAHSEAISAVHSTTIDIISDLSKKYGFNLVLPSTQVLFVGNELNITLEVITNLNKQLKTININYNPKDTDIKAGSN